MRKFNRVYSYVLFCGAMLFIPINLVVAETITIYASSSGHVAHYGSSDKYSGTIKVGKYYSFGIHVGTSRGQVWFDLPKELYSAYINSATLNFWCTSGTSGGIGFTDLSHKYDGTTGTDLYDDSGSSAYWTASNIGGSQWYSYDLSSSAISDLQADVDLANQTWFGLGFTADDYDERIIDGSNAGATRPYLIVDYIPLETYFLDASYDEYTDRVELDWDDPDPGQGVDFFYVHRKMDGSDIWEIQGEGSQRIYASNFTDDKVDPGIEAEYKVTPYVLYGSGDSAQWPGISDTDYGARKLSQPQASAGDGSRTDGVSISWNAVSGADEYLVERYFNDGDYDRDVGTFTGTACVDDDYIDIGMNYIYVVIAQNDDDFESDDSLDKGNQGWLGFPDLESVYVEDHDDDQIDIAWAWNDGGFDDDEVNFKIYRGTSSDYRSAKHIDSISASYECRDKDYDLVAGQTYYYWVKPTTEDHEVSLSEDSLYTSGTLVNSLSISPSSRSHNSTSYSDQTIGVSANVSWIATKTASWITITGDSSGSGNGTVTYNVLANTGPARSDTITVDGGGITRNFTVNQAALPATTYTVSYDANEATSGTVPSAQTKTHDETLPLRTNSGNLVRTGYIFAGWNTASDGSGTGYAAGGSYTTNASVKLYAKWTPITYTVTYDGNGHTGGSTVNSSHTYDVSKALTANGYTKTGNTFAGWATSSGGNVVYSDGQNVANLTSAQGATVTLYAKWTPKTYPEKPINPTPADGATNVDMNADLSWSDGGGATSYDVYFGPSGSMTSRGNQTDKTYDPGSLGYGVNYSWRIDAKNDDGTTTGVVWSFTTTNAPPVVPFTYTTNNNTITITGYTGSGGAVSITNRIDGLPVTTIGRFSFFSCTSLTSVTIPDSVTNMGDNAFYFCDNLTSVTIGDGVISIADYAFSDCTSLTSVTIGTGVTSIGYSAFAGCSGLTSVTIPDSVTTIGTGAFDYCSGLTSIMISDSVTSIGALAFRECTSLTSVTIGNSVLSIGEQAFWDCTSLTSVTIPDSVTSIGEYAFYRCTGLTSATIGDGVITIGDYAFCSCDNLTAVTIGISVTSIGDSAFRYCAGLTSVTIGNSVISIEEGAFYGCSSLTNVTIPDSVTNMGDLAFQNCPDLISVYFWGNAPDIDNPTVFWPSDHLIVYHLADASGWPPNPPDPWGGRPTELWIPNCTVTFDSRSGAAANPPSKSVTYGSTYESLATTTRTGFTFGGWYTGVNGTGSKVTSATTVAITSPQTLYAKWIPVTYALTVKNGTGSGSYTNQQWVAISATVPSGRRFDRWLGDTQYVDSVTSESTYLIMPAFDITLTATNKPNAMPWLNLLLE